MKIIDGIKYLTIGEVAKILERRTLTIKNWYEWAETQTDALEHPLPEVYQDLDQRKTRYFKEEDVSLLIEFKKNIQYGQLADVNRVKWGKKGREVIEKLEAEQEKNLKMA